MPLLPSNFTDEDYQKCRNGDSTALGRLYDSLRCPSTIVRRIISNPGWRFGEDSEDVFHEIFTNNIVPALKSFAAIETTKDREDLERFLADVTKKACISIWRKRKTLKAGGDRLHISLSEFTEDVICSSHTPGDTAREQELREHLYAAIRQLKPNCREIIRLRLTEMTIKEIAQELDLKPKTAESRLTRCLNTLQKLFLKRFSGMDDFL